MSLESNQDQLVESLTINLTKSLELLKAFNELLDRQRAALEAHKLDSTEEIRGDIASLNSQIEKLATIRNGLVKELSTVLHIPDEKMNISFLVPKVVGGNPTLLLLRQEYGQILKKIEQKLYFNSTFLSKLMSINSIIAKMFLRKEVEAEVYDETKGSASKVQSGHIVRRSC
ncbi:MAG: flagellar export chaperone FlgN [Nitrospinota bacterium]